MMQAAVQPGTTVKESFRRLFRLVDLDDRPTARVAINARLAEGLLSPSLQCVLRALLAFLDRDSTAERTLIREALELDPDNSHAHYWLATVQDRDRQIPEAAGSLQRALQIDPGMAEAWALFGGMALLGRNHDVALHSFVTAVQCDVDNPGYWQRLNQWLPRVQIQGPMPAERALLLTALERQKIEFSGILQVIYAVLASMPEVRQLLTWHRAGTLSAEVQSGAALPLLDDALLRLVLRRTTLHDVAYEELFTGLRQALLEAIVQDKVPPAQRESALRFTSALAVYALTTEFALYAAPGEDATLADCHRQLAGLETDDPALPMLAAAAACYGLLADASPAPTAALTAPATALPEYREMCHLHLTEPLALREQQARVPRFSAIQDQVSRAVRQQYEHNPYPRWRFLGEAEPATFDNRIVRALPHLSEDQRPRLQTLPGDPLEVLVAGCGTGRNALWCAREYPRIHVLAVDLSSASLAYAMLKAGELGIGNVDFRQGDLLQIPALGRSFDMIEAIGVLHHMDDPAAGLGALARCLRPGGWMKVALYSHLARGAVREARRRIAEQQIPATADGIRAFRHGILSNPADPLHGPCIDWRDFFSLSECRDLLFHVQEHQFTTAALAELIRSAGLEFMGFEADAVFAANASPPVTDPRSLEQWGVFEEAHPDFFGSMYVMWLRKTR